MGLSYKIRAESRKSRAEKEGKGRGAALSFLHSAFLLFVLLWIGSAVWAKGYSIRGQKVQINTKDHWSAWTFPKDALEVGDDGRVKPRFIRKHTLLDGDRVSGINACLNADRFVYEIEKAQQEEFIHSWYEKDTRRYLIRGGIKQAGTREEEADHIIDGRADTFWEPDLDDPPENWWIEVDLGRAVCAKKLVVRFAEEGRGDPFLRFRVLTSTGERAFRIGTAMKYVLAGETIKPHKHQRIFEFELSPTLPADAHWSGGRVLQYVRILMTDSDRDRAEQITKARYEVLSPEQRGTVEYIWKIAGEERFVDKATYENLPPEERGEIRYYRKEQPRLAELEVWSVGDNVSLGVLDRGGSIYDFYENAAPEEAFDGGYTTVWQAMCYWETGSTAKGGMIKVDLGALFWVDTIRLVIHKSLGRSWVLRGYLTRVSDGSRASETKETTQGIQPPEIFRNLIWDTVSPESKQISSGGLWGLSYFEDTFEPRKARYVEFRHLELLRGFQTTYTVSRIGEFQIYGEGYVPEVTMTSDLIELGGSRNLTSIAWDADVPLGTQVEIQTRTGDELREVKHYFDKGGTEVTEDKYNRLPSFSRGPITTEFLPGADWSNWSAAYEQSGDVIVSPSPRKYLMIQAKLLSDDPYAAATLRSITVSFREPVAEQVMGEISPDREVSEGRPQDFAVLLGTRFTSIHSGFDDILVQSPPAVKMHLLGVSLGDEDDFRGEATEDFSPDEQGNFVNAQGEPLKVLSAGSDSLWVRLPEVIRRGSKGWIQLQFRTTIFLNGTVFKVSVAHSESPGSWQWVDAGDVTDWLPGRGLKVSVPMDDRIIGDVEVEPNPFTPNGDGVHDEARFRFSVFKVNTARKVEVVIRTLEGNVVRRLWERRESAAGTYHFLWDGRDDSGERAPPGIYSAEIYVGADAESGPNRTARVVSVVY